MFSLYKEKGSCWSTIATEFPEKNERQVKNRFYSTLRRLATKESSENKTITESLPLTKKKHLLKFVDKAIEIGHECRSKRGRKKKLTNYIEENPKTNQEIISNNNQALAQFESVFMNCSWSLTNLAPENIQKAETELEQLLKMQQSISNILATTKECIDQKITC